MFLRDSLVASFNAIHTNPYVSISEVQTKHLEMLFDFLIASAHTASVETILKKYGIGSGTKLLDQRFPVSMYEDTVVQKRGISSSSMAKGSLPAYPEEKSLTLDTNMGSVKVKILSARTRTDSATLAFTFEYLGDANLGLSPYAVHYMSHALEPMLKVGYRFWKAHYSMRSEMRRKQFIGLVRLIDGRILVKFYFMEERMKDFLDSKGSIIHIQAVFGESILGNL